MMMKQILVSFTLCLFAGFSLQATDYDVIDFGARPDGIMLATTTIQRAIDVVHERGGGRLVFPAGKYLTGTVYLKSNVTLHLEAGAVLLGSTNPYDYVRHPKIGWPSMIYAVNQENIGITGEGTINGQGFEVAYNIVAQVHNGIFKDALKYDRTAGRPQNIYFLGCAHVAVTGITLRDAADRNHSYDHCKDVLLDHVRAECNAFWNEDGVDVVDCDGVVIKNCWFDAADDVFCFKSDDANSICQNVVMENCVGRSGANGLKFGTGSRGGFRNFKITNLTIYDTYRSAIAIQAVDGALIENIEIDGVKSINNGNVIFLRIGDRWRNSKRPIMKNIRISNVYAEVPAFKPDAGYGYEGPIEDLPRNISPASIVGLPGLPIQDVILKNVTIVYPGGGDPFYAKVGTAPEELDAIPEMPAAYPEFSQWKELPAWGVYIRHAEGIIFDNVTLTAQKQDYRPAIVLDDVKNSDFSKTTYNEPGAQGKKQIVTHQSNVVQ
jgi:hypothetical protein